MSVSNLPLPYAGELLYGVLSRVRVHLWFNSPKQLLKQVYGHAGLIASMRFGSNLNALENCYNFAGLSSQTLMYKHTLWPLIAPFIPQERRQTCESWLSGQRDIGVTLSSGIAASRLKYPKHLRYCPLCVREQINNIGEACWQRMHQVPAIDVCLTHKCKLQAHTADNLQRHQHEFFPLGLLVDSKVELASIEPFFSQLNDYVVSLLNLENVKNPSFEQWSAYYRSLAAQNGLNRGQQVKHSEIETLITRQFPPHWLELIGLAVGDEETNWTRSIFRKHRKSFSFIEHYIINRSLMRSQWNVEQTLNEVTQYNHIRWIKPKELNVSPPLSAYERYRQEWQRLVILAGAKQARAANSATYAWLYRHDRPWLLSINSDYRVEKKPHSQKVNWRLRDKSYARELIKIINNADVEIQSPQHTQTWLLTHFTNKTSLEKWLPKLPITNNLLQKYAETTPEYQIRRITRSIITGEPRLTSQLWYLMRMSGLSKERLTPLARQFIRLLLEHSIVRGPTTSIQEIIE